MPKGAKGQKSPADVIGNAIRVAKIVTGDEDEDFPVDDSKDRHCRAAGALAGCPFTVERGRRVALCLMFE